MKKKAVAIAGSALGLSLLLILTVPLRAQNPQSPSPEIDDDQSPAHLALLDYQRGDFDAARTAIDAAEKAQPDDLSIKILKSRILTEQREFDEGEKLLRSLITSDGPLEAQIALGDLLLRKRDFDRANVIYTQALKNKPDDPDILLKIIYTRVSVSDFITAGKEMSRLKPLDPDNPSYYFAKAALAQAVGNATEADQDIETARTLYGSSITNRYLKIYLQVFAPGHASSPTDRAEPPKTNAPPATPHP